MAQQRQVLSAKRSNLGNPSWWKENSLWKVVLWYPHMHCGTHVHAHTNILTDTQINIKNIDAFMRLMLCYCIKEAPHTQISKDEKMESAKEGSKWRCWYLGKESTGICAYESDVLQTLKKREKEHSIMLPHTPFCHFRWSQNIILPIRILALQSNSLAIFFFSM